MRSRTVLLMASVAVALAGCTGVPGSSQPNIVQHLGANAPQSAPQPEPGVDPRSLVQDFLSANEIDAANHGAARVYLTRNARNRWTDTSVTILDNPIVSLYNPKTHIVSATGRQIATVNADGVYTPDLQGNGSAGGETVQFQFTLKTVNGQFRIDSLRNGLILSEDQFKRVFPAQLVVYFYDNAEHYLIPDARYSALTDPQALASFLVQQLVAGPQQDLLNAESNAEFPAQAAASRVTVRLGTPTAIEVPGATQLDTTHRNRLAAQLALTLDQVTPGASFTITDGDKPVRIPAVGSEEFTATTFASSTGPQSQLPHPSLYYVDNGAVVDDRGVPLSGLLGTGQYGLASVAVAKIPASTQLLVAGVAASGSGEHLLVGTESAGLKVVPKISGKLSRPSWAAGLDEVWVGSGAKLYRVITSANNVGAAVKVGTVAVPGLPAGAKITALRLSPEGSQVAMVISTSETTAQAYIGTVARDQGQVRVDALAPISPVGVYVNDVAWNAELKLFLVGKQTNTQEGLVVEVQVDGSLWTPRTAPSLPGPPDSITVAENLPAWVSVGDAVFQQNLESWTNPNGAGTNAGLNPVYLE